MAGERLTPYLRYSAAVHAGLLAALFLVPFSSRTGPEQVYRIDFVGPSAGIVNRDPEATPSPADAAATQGAKRLEPMSRPDEFAKRRRSAPLPRPSLLGAAPDQEEKVKPAAAAAPDGAAPCAPSSAQAGQGSGEAAVSADMPDFPYPWYIAELRTALWSLWSARMPWGGGEAMIEFSILRSGEVVDLRAESSSGDGNFDRLALQTARDASPFPPLPKGFPADFLKVHVKFRAR